MYVSLDQSKKELDGFGKATSLYPHSQNTHEVDDFSLLDDKKLELFMRQLSKMLEANLPLEKSLTIIANGGNSDEETEIFRDIISGLRDGKSFSEMVGRHLSEHNSIMVALLKAGELSGNLAQAVVPMAAIVVFWLSATVQQYWWIIASVIGLFIYFIVVKLRHGGIYNLVTSIFAILPGFKELPDKIEINVICRLLGSLITNKVKLKNGAKVSVAFMEAECFPKNLIQMVHIGEESGELGPMFLRSADFLDEEIDGKIKRFLTLFEPIMLVVIGVMIGGLLYGLFSAILSVNDTVL